MSSFDRKAVTEKAALERRIDELCAEVEYDRQTSRSRLERIDQLKAENAKLRELCADIYKGFRGVVFEGWSYSSEDFRMYERYMRKLGIEVKA